MFRFLQKTMFVGLVAVISWGTYRWLLPSTRGFNVPSVEVLHTTADWHASCDRLDRILMERWEAAGIEPAPPADARVVARRLALGLVGTIPSLEQWRMWEQWPSEERHERWTDHLLSDRRSSDYLAERLARAYVGTDNGPFLVFRRRRFVAWLSDQIHANRRYDQLVQSLMTESGLWTSVPAVNFVTSTIGSGEEEGQPNPVPLATRASRAFLGLRIDCAQCHDDRLGGAWTQADFHQFAAFFAATRNSIAGIRDVERTYRVTYLNSDRDVDVPCQVPFRRELLNTDPSLPGRQRLAMWITHHDNDAFSRAIVNRVWGILLGRPLVEPVDDVPLSGPWPAALTYLANDFREHHFNVHRLARLIANSRAFGLQSHAPQELTGRHEAEWACFPLLRLRPEQVVGAIQQAASLETLYAESHILVRLAHQEEGNTFIRRFGDGGNQELDPLHETIPQNLLLMNGTLVAEKTKVDLFANAASRIAQLARTDDLAVQTLFLTVLSREPSADELVRYRARLSGTHGEPRSQVLCDLAWVLMNSSEFGWSH